jgi:O-antigen/teichoic acid export membrane protein
VIILAYSLSFLSFASNLKWGFQALEKNGSVAAALVLSQMAYLAGILVYVKGPGDALKVPLLFFGSELSGAVLLLVQYRRQGLRLWSPRSRHLSWALLKEAFPLASTRALRTLTVNFDLLLLGLTDTPLAVGLYSAVSRIVLLIRELGDLYYMPLFPALSRAAKDSVVPFVTFGRGGLRYAAVIIFPLAVGGCLTGPQLLSFVFGPGYTAGSPTLCLLLATTVFVMLTGTCRLGLVAYGRQGILFRIMAVGTAVNVGMNSILIPRYSIVGGALSALASEALIFALAWMAIAKLVSFSPWSPIVRPALAAGGMGVVLWVLPALPFLETISIGAASYTILLFLSGAVRLDELRDAWRVRPISSAVE